MEKSQTKLHFVLLVICLVLWAWWDVMCKYSLTHSIHSTPTSFQPYRWFRQLIWTDYEWFAFPPFGTVLSHTITFWCSWGIPMHSSWMWFGEIEIRVWVMWMDGSVSWVVLGCVRCGIQSKDENDFNTVKVKDIFTKRGQNLCPCCVLSLWHIVIICILPIGEYRLKLSSLWYTCAHFFTHHLHWCPRFEW